MIKFILCPSKIVFAFSTGISLIVAACTLALPAHGQTVTTFYTFPNEGARGPNGARPIGALIQATDGNFYSTTQVEGLLAGGGAGVVFKITTNGIFTKLTNFSFNDLDLGLFPSAGLVQGTNDGNFYGTTTLGGLPTSRGNIFKIDTNGMTTVLARFNGSNGFFPNCVLVQGSNGNFYGTTTGGTTNEGGGAGGGTGSAAVTNGTIFMMTPGGTLTNLAIFAGTNGQNPLAGLILHPNGSFYGTTSTGGTNGGFGTVFKMSASGILTSLYSFAGINGANPFGGLTIAANGILYGTTQGGGENSSGTIFQITPTGSLTSLISFNGANGSAPKAAPKQGADGNFYGTTSTGGTNGLGTVYVLKPNGTLTSLYSFQAVPDGSGPQADLLQALDGNFYGTARNGGTISLTGTIFKLDLRPRLSTAVAGSEVTLSWLDYATGYTLQSATNLTPVIAWVNVTNTPVVVNGHFTVTTSISNTATFFRLKK